MDNLIDGDVGQEVLCEWEVRYDELHKAGEPMPGPWRWDIHDHSMATLCGGGEDAIVGHIMAISPCKSCQDKAEPKTWVWGRCQTPSEDNARLIAMAPDLLDYVRRKSSTDQEAMNLLIRCTSGSREPSSGNDSGPKEA